MNSLEKLRMYHEILDTMLASVAKLQSKGGVPFSFTYRGKRYDVNLKVFLMFIIGDTASTDLFLALALAIAFFSPCSAIFNPELWQVHSTILAYSCLILGIGSLNKCYTSETRSHNYG
jgi:hypothetical protein